MKALYSAGAAVPWSRVMHDHRKALVPLALVFAVNLAVLVAVVLPLVRNVSANETRSQAAAREAAAAQKEFQDAEAIRDGKTRAGADLETFYKEVLPANVSAARRTLQSKILKLADDHDVDYKGGAGDTQELRGSALQRQTYSVTLTGDYDDLRALVYDIETSPEFIVIDHIVLVQGQTENAPLSLTMELSTYYRLPVARTASDGGR
jgi:hypothetical protein